MEAWSKLASTFSQPRALDFQNPLGFHQVALADDGRSLAVGTADGLVYVVDIGSERIAEFSRDGQGAAPQIAMGATSTPPV